MIKSMTGYCKMEVSHENTTCDIEIKSVNHRFLDIKVFLPKQFDYLSEIIKKRIKNKLSRGKIDLHIRLTSEAEVSEDLTINQPALKNLKSILKGLEYNLNKNIELNLSGLLSIKNLIIYKETESQKDDYEALFFMAVDRAADELIKMREREGELLRKDISQRVEIMADRMDKIESYKERALSHYIQKLEKNLRNLSLKYDPRDPRIIQEIGFFVDRSDITEEIIRFKTHLTQIKELLEIDAPAGRKLDFLLQELNRETNTVCSKANYVKITQNGVDLKSEIEKIREQAQNIE